MSEQFDVIALTADIVAAYVSKNPIRGAELPDLIATVHASLLGTSDPKVEEPAPELKPAVPIKKSVTPDYIISLEDGRKFKSLRRHLQTAFGMTPDDYRAKWGLPPDYPMVAPGYAAKRSELAKATGLGSNRRGAVPEPQAGEPSADQAWEAAAPQPAATAPDTPPEVAVEAPAKRRPGRPKKAA